MRTEQQTERLRTLSRELRKVPPEAFDIASYTSGASERIGCGTTACAIGHCPFIFPESWKFRCAEPFLIESSSGSPSADADEFFGLDCLKDPIFAARGYFQIAMMREVLPSDVSDRIDELLARDAEATT